MIEPDSADYEIFPRAWQALELMTALDGVDSDKPLDDILAGIGVVASKYTGASLLYDVIPESRDDLVDYQFIFGADEVETVSSDIDLSGVLDNAKITSDDPDQVADTEGCENPDCLRGAIGCTYEEFAGFEAPIFSNVIPSNSAKLAEVPRQFKDLILSSAPFLDANQHIELSQIIIKGRMARFLIHQGVDNESVQLAIKEAKLAADYFMAAYHPLALQCIDRIPLEGSLRKSDYFAVAVGDGLRRAVDRYDYRTCLPFFPHAMRIMRESVRAYIDKHAFVLTINSTANRRLSDALMAKRRGFGDLTEEQVLLDLYRSPLSYGLGMEILSGVGQIYNRPDLPVDLKVESGMFVSELPAIIDSARLSDQDLQVLFLTLGMFYEVDVNGDVALSYSDKWSTEEVSFAMNVPKHEVLKKVARAKRAIRFAHCVPEIKRQCYFDDEELNDIKSLFMLEPGVSGRMPMPETVKVFHEVFGVDEIMSAIHHATKDRARQRWLKLIYGLVPMERYGFSCRPGVGTAQRQGMSKNVAVNLNIASLELLGDIEPPALLMAA